MTKGKSRDTRKRPKGKPQAHDMSAPGQIIMPKRTKGKAVIGRLPGVDPTIIITRKIRFNLGASSNVSANFALDAGALCAFLSMGSSTNVVFSLFQCARLVKIEAYLTPVALGPTSLSIYYPPTVTGANLIVGGLPGMRTTDTVCGATSTLHVSASPPSGSQSGNWYNQGNSAGLTLAVVEVEQGSNANIGFIVDVTVQGALTNLYDNAGQSPPAFISYSGAIAGHVYALPLFGSPGAAASTSTGIPVGYEYL